MAVERSEPHQGVSFVVVELEEVLDERVLGDGAHAPGDLSERGPQAGLVVRAFYASAQVCLDDLDPDFWREGTQWG